MKIEYKLLDAGWATATVTEGGKSWPMTVSYLHDSLGNLVTAALDLEEQAEAMVLFMAEPGEHHLVLHRNGGTLEWELRAYEDWASWGITPPEQFELKLRGTTSLRDLQEQTAEILDQVLDECSLVEYLRRWIEAPFPLAEYRRLCERLGRPEKATMRAVRIHELGGIEKMLEEEIPVPLPGPGQVLIHVHAAGVAPWDALIRSGGSVILPTLPLTLGSDFSGRVMTLGPGVEGFREGEPVYGVTNEQFTGAYAEYALAQVGMIARKPENLSYVEAASVPAVAVTAWQMLYDYGQVEEGQRVLIHGAAGNVGAYAVQMARHAGAHIIATGRTAHLEAIRELGADEVIDADARPFEEQIEEVDLVLDTLGGDILRRSFSVLKRGGALVSVVEKPEQELAKEHGVRSEFFLVGVTTAGLERIGRLLEANALRTNVGEVLPLSKARLAHEMLEGKRHKPGKIVLQISDP